MSFENVFNCSTIYHLNFCPMHLLHSSSFYNECQSQSAKVLLLQAFFNAFIVASVVGHYRFIDFWSQKAWVFYQNASVSSPEPLSFFQNTGVLKNWSKIFEETAVFCRKFVQKALNIAFFLCALCKYAQFWLIYSKYAENKMSFEFHLATISTGSLSLARKILEFFGQ